VRDIDWIDDALRKRVIQLNQAKKAKHQDEIEVVELMIDRLLDDRAAVQKQPA
jgi:hypothetical protein